MRIPVLIFASTALVASQNPQPLHVGIPYLSKAPSMARDADLSTWEGALQVSDFGLIMPDDKGENRWRTVGHFAWGPDALYVAVEAFDPEPSKVRAWLHKRDDFGDLDFVGLDIDPSGKGQSCLRLLVTPLGGQMDGIVTDTTGEDYTYDCLWDSVGLLTPQGYLVKYRVPYSSLRRRPGEWGLRLLRIMPRERRYGIAWPRMSRDIQCDICQMAKASGAPVEKPGSPFMVIPFVSYARTQTLDGAGILGPPQDSKRLGMDLRYSSTAVTLEGTYRPDFNNIEADVDPLQINSRFKVLYPEKRPFFLEGMELLGVTGAQRQFFSRSILDPLYGLKASGQASWASWSALTSKDDGGGQILVANGAGGVDALPTRDAAASARFRLDEKGSGLSVLGTDKLLLGGPMGSGGKSGGIYLDTYLGSEFHFTGSSLMGLSRLPQADGTLLSQRGTATAAELDWNTRNWAAYALEQTTSPDLVLVSGFTDLQGYRRQMAGFNWHEKWNDGGLSQANVTLRGKRLLWWDGSPMDRSTGWDAYLETAGRWSATVNWDLAGRSWTSDRTNATRGLTLTVNWKHFGWLQPWVSTGRSRTIDLDSGDPACFRTASLGASGNVSSVGYSLSAQQSELDREEDKSRIVRARELVGSGIWQLPLSVYLKVQCFVVRYDGSSADSVDKFAKAILGWQPNAFTHAYVGWSGRRRRDPANLVDTERLAEKGLFAKLAYAMQF